ncbi:MAG TPA: FecR domain-containing protein [Luteimonas sp.]|nr:FecR domain-containing protein [Luteimonas sp.]
MRWTLAVFLAAFAAASYAQDIGQIKTVRGSVHLERNGQTLVAEPGMPVRQADKLVTGDDGAVGVTFLDNSLLSAGPRSVLGIDRYSFDTTTHAGQFDASLQKGSLAVVSGKIVKQEPGAMRVRTPASVMGVRGTEFLVRVDEPAR